MAAGLTKTSGADGAFERQKWAADLDLRQRGVVVAEAAQRSREAEVALQKDEIALKRAEAQASRWTSPLVVAIIAASLAAAGNATIAVINGRLERELEGRKAAASLAADARKAEANLILEVVKTGDPAKAAANLTFLLDAGLISDQARFKAIRRYLASPPAGGGVSLPAATGRNFSFEHTAGDTPAAELAVSSALSPYTKHLTAIGFPANLPRVGVRIDQNSQNPSYYLPSKKMVVLSREGSRDALFPISEYTIHALEIGRPQDTGGNLQRIGVEYGVRDYLVASYLDDPNLGERYRKIFGMVAPSLQILAPRPYSSITATSEPHDVGAVWASALWDLRRAAGGKGPGADKVDAAVARAWLSVPVATPNEQYPAMMLDKLKAEARRQGLDGQFREILKARGFP